MADVRMIPVTGFLAYGATKMGDDEISLNFTTAGDSLDLQLPRELAQELSERLQRVLKE